MTTPYSRSERLWLWLLAIISFCGLNVAFVYGLFFKPDAMAEALRNPIAAAFIGETALLLGTWAYLLTQWGKARLHWGWFVALSLLGGMAFALPIVLLWPGKQRS